jgi:hypothetical protein
VDEQLGILVGVPVVQETRRNEVATGRGDDRQPAAFRHLSEKLDIASQVDRGVVDDRGDSAVDQGAELVDAPLDDGPAREGPGVVLSEARRAQHHMLMAENTAQPACGHWPGH